MSSINICRNKKVLVIFVVLALVISLPAILFMYNSHQQVIIGTSEASWAIKYSDIQAMSRGVDIILIGEILEAVLRPGDLFGMTDFDLKVSQVIKPSDFQNSTVRVTQTGGYNLRGEYFEIRDDPLMQVGDKVILFLEKIEGVPGLFKYPGPWGRFLIKDGKVYSLDLLYPERFKGERLDADLQGTTINGKMLSDFVAEIKSYLEVK